MEEGWTVEDVKRGYDTLNAEIQPYLDAIGTNPLSTEQRDQILKWHHELSDMYQLPCMLELIAEGAPGVNEDISILIMTLGDFL